MAAQLGDPLVPGYAGMTPAQRLMTHAGQAPDAQKQLQKTLDFSLVEAMKKNPATFTINSPVVLQIGGESFSGILKSLQDHEDNKGLHSH